MCGVRLLLLTASLCSTVMKIAANNMFVQCSFTSFAHLLVITIYIECGEPHMEAFQLKLVRGHILGIS